MSRLIGSGCLKTDEQVFLEKFLFEIVNARPSESEIIFAIWEIFDFTIFICLV